MTTSWRAPFLNNTDVDKRDVRWQCTDDPAVGPHMHTDFANLDGSLNEDGTTHSIVLDLDGRHEYRPSTTPGHGHLISDATLPWPQYLNLLDALCDADVISDGYYGHALRRHQTFVRKAGEIKGDTAADSD